MRLLLNTLLLLFLAFAATSLVAPLATAATYDYDSDNTAIIGRTLTTSVNTDDDFASIALRHQLGFDALVAANPLVNPWFPTRGTKVVLPSQHILPDVEHEGIVVNLPEKRLYYFDNNNKKVHTYPVGIGRAGWDTPVADTHVVAVQENPQWKPPQSIINEYRKAGLSIASVIPAGPDNPLGDYAIRLDLSGYLIHGTNDPAGVGLRVSHGCIRLYPDDIRELAELVDPGTRVQIINQPIKWARSNRELQLEAHQPLPSENTNTMAGHTHLVKQSPGLKNWLASKRKKHQLFSGVPQAVPSF